MFKERIFIDLFKFTLAALLTSCCTTVWGFDVFIYASNKNKPDFESLGATRSIIIYEQQFYKENENRLDPIKPKQLNNVFQQIELSHAAFIQIDIEAWLGKGHPIAQEYIDRYSQLAQQIKATFPKKYVGFYDVAPTWAHWYIEDKPVWAATWNIENIRRQKIADSVDALHPCLYTYHDNYEDWERWADVILKEAKVMAKGKPVIPFLWPRFHQSSVRKENAMQYLPQDFWKKQLDYVAKNADGAAIWNDDEYGDWNENAPWWKEVKILLKAAKNNNLLNIY